MKARENAMSRGECEKDPQKLATMMRVLPPTLKPVKPDLLQEKFDIGGKTRNIAIQLKTLY